MGTISRLHEETYQRLRKEFPHLTLKENARPGWLISSNLTRLEIDIYIEELRTAVEIQGLQHYEFTPHFHKTYKEFTAQRKRDQEKRDLCRGNGIRMVEIATRSDLSGFISELREDEAQKNLPETKFSYSFPGIWKQEERIKSHRKDRRSILCSKRARKWLKRKIARKRLERKGLPIPEHLLPGAKTIGPLAGTQKQRHRARVILKHQKLSDTVHLVWGGDEMHFIRYENNNYSCDCWCSRTEGRLCSHIIKILYFS